MFGLLLGTACLVGLVWVLRGGRRNDPCSGGRFERDWRGGHDFGWRERGPRGFGRGMFLRWIFERLDTTPGQERVIRSAVDDFFDHAKGARRDVEATRSDVARAMAAESFDAEAMGEAFVKHDGALDDVRKAFVEALAKVHEVLDERQRARLSELIESGLGRRFHGPYRSAY
jgi:uncharacterized membrane protein